MCEPTGTESKVIAGIINKNARIPCLLKNKLPFLCFIVVKYTFPMTLLETKQTKQLLPPTNQDLICLGLFLANCHETSDPVVTHHHAHPICAGLGIEPRMSSMPGSIPPAQV